MSFKTVCKASVCLMVSALGCGTQPITIGDGESAVGESAGSVRQELGATSSYFLSDGKSSVQVAAIDGGAVKAPVITETTGLDGIVHKRLGLPEYEPVTIPILANTPASYVDWAQAALSRSFPTKDLSASYCDANRKLVFSRELDGSTLTALTFGPFDASSTTAQPLFKETFTPHTTTTRAGDHSACKGTAGSNRPFTGNNFVFTLGQLDATGVTRIDEIRLASTTAAASSGHELPAPGRPLSIPNLRVYVSQRRVDSWQKWFNDFVVKGLNDAAHELSGELELTAADGTPLLTLGMKGVGIARLASPGSEQAGDLPAGTWIADLYVEQMSVARAPN
jgi:hypothetical protein